jgi:protein-S-isoprenylcysteine O-methyltransferase Ste14
MTDPTPATPPPAASGWGPKGKVREPIVVILLSIVTLSIYFFVWSYKVFHENREFSGEGVGGVIGVILALLLGIVNWFLLPSEIGNIHERMGHEKPVRGVTGFWNLIPIVGGIIWIFKVQGAMNRLYR